MTTENNNAKLEPDMTPIVLNVTYDNDSSTTHGKILVSKFAKNNELYSYLRRLTKASPNAKLEIFYYMADYGKSQATFLPKTRKRLVESYIDAEVYTCLIVKCKEDFALSHIRNRPLETIPEEMMTDIDDQQTRGAGRSPKNFQNQYFNNINPPELTEQEQYELAVQNSLADIKPQKQILEPINCKNHI